MSHAPPHLPSPAPSPFLAGGTEPDPARVRAELEKELQALAQDLYEMEVCAGEVGPGMEDAVPGYLAKINTALANLAAIAPHVTDSVPRSIIEYKNPHQYTKTALSRATGENQYTLGRVLGLESFRRQLADGVSEAFPDVPLPERRHRPVGGDGSEAGSNPAAAGNGGGEGENARNEVKPETVSAGGDDGRGEPRSAPADAGGEVKTELSASIAPPGLDGAYHGSGAELGAGTEHKPDENGMQIE